VGGGTQPSCRAGVQTQWGGNAIYDIVDGQLVFRSYFKMPAIQTNQENCVSHLPSLVPVPGRDIMVQAWYQAGASLIDFTDSSNPKEIGYFDRGPISAGTNLILGGFWSTYYFNGAIYGSEIARVFDSLQLTPTAELSVNEIKAASEVKLRRLTPQHQPRIRWRPSFAVVRVVPRPARSCRGDSGPDARKGGAVHRPCRGARGARPRLGCSSAAAGGGEAAPWRAVPRSPRGA
jgi:hypothetical protein